jgi:hypothetical protein
MVGSIILDDIVSLHNQIRQHPYSIDRRIKLAALYDGSGYPDLAAGENYRTVLLIDEALEESGEYHEDAFDNALSDYGSQYQVYIATGSDIKEYVNRHLRKEVLPLV